MKPWMKILSIAPAAMLVACNGADDALPLALGNLAGPANAAAAAAALPQRSQLAPQNIEARDTGPNSSADPRQVGWAEAVVSAKLTGALYSAGPFMNLAHAYDAYQADRAAPDAPPPALRPQVPPAL